MTGPVRPSAAAPGPVSDEELTALLRRRADQAVPLAPAAAIRMATRESRVRPGRLLVARRLWLPASVVATLAVAIAVGPLGMGPDGSSGPGAVPTDPMGTPAPTVPEPTAEPTAPEPTAEPTAPEPTEAPTLGPTIDPADVEPGVMSAAAFIVAIEADRAAMADRIYAVQGSLIRDPTIQCFSGEDPVACPGIVLAGLEVPNVRVFPIGEVGPGPWDDDAEPVAGLLAIRVTSEDDIAQGPIVEYLGRLDRR